MRGKYKMSKCIYKQITDNLDKEEFEQYYLTHTYKDIAKHYNFKERYINSILHYFNIELGSKERQSYIQKTYCTEEKRQKCAKSGRGRIYTEEMRQKISESNKGHHNHHANSTTWQKGNIPWNKGLKGAQKWVDGQKERYYKSLNSNGWFQRSKPEENLYQELCDMYSSNDIVRGYIDNERYPFRCDFYIKSEDKFIELNRFWHHGPHPFDPNNEDDLRLLNEWKQKAETNNQYKAAIETWTIRDVKKIQIAKENNLNYQLIY